MIKLEDSLNGGFGGLYGEVVTCDTYRLKQLKFKPDVVFDVGANVGIFSRFVRELFPEALIVSVEPDPSNCAVFRQFTKDTNTILIEKALGLGPVYHGTTARNGSGETYLSTGVGFPKQDMDAAANKKNGLEFSHVPTIMLPELVRAHSNSGQKRLLKIDCEGGENVIWEDEESISILQEMDYVTMELHFYALTGREHPMVRKLTEKALATLAETHNCERQEPHFWATKRL